MRTPLHDEIENTQRAMWDQFSTGWERWDDVVQQMLGPVGEVMIRSLGIRTDQSHLDVAAGTGQPGLTIAQLAPQGRVVLTDLAPGMLAAARRIAETARIDNVETRECSADRLPFPDATFDSATCRFGLMFVPDLARTVAELARVVRPGGRIAVSVWAGPDDNPWATIPAAAIAAEVETPEAIADAPGMFRCAAPGSVTDLFRAAGLIDITEVDVSLTLVTDSPREYWRLLTELTAPVVAALDQLDEAGRERIAAAVQRDASKHQSSGALRIPALSRCIAGTK
jgi:ubiquinone/menaquinone biosynthesis C-methylase UbiE